MTGLTAIGNAVYDGLIKPDLIKVDGTYREPHQQ